MAAAGGVDAKLMRSSASTASCAIIGLIHRIKQALLFDHLIGAREGEWDQARLASR